ncbi:MAG: glycerol kinase GlpK [Rhodobacteraceae bacterium]|nr:glycerol kinase GlpK [Paracoccaceae bacterium]
MTILAIDQGTTSTRAILFDDALRPLATGQQEFSQHFPEPGWVEHDPDDIWQSVLATCRTALAGADPADVAAIGITNQRETIVAWDRQSGQTFGNAIVWQDRRTAAHCAALKADGLEDMVNARTGLLLDPYFSASKIAWMLENVPAIRAAADAGRLALGTIDSFLIWRLTGGKVHATDATNAARTMLYDIGRGDWDADLLALFGVPASALPEVRDSAGDFGTTDPALFGAAIAIRGVAGDQQAASIGQACFRPGMLKSTYGTGCFALMNTGQRMIRSTNRLLTTIASRLNGEVTYALEGSIFVAGSGVQWLRDGLGIIAEAAEVNALAAAADPDQRVYLVPAFTGLGAPYWDADCRGAIYGLSRGTGRAEIARAALQSVAFQTRDLIAAMQADWPEAGETILRVDGGMAASDWAMQAIADQLDAPVDRPVVTETTALGAAYLAGLGAGITPGPEAFAASWALQHRFTPDMDSATRASDYAGWQDAVRRTLGGHP